MDILHKNKDFIVCIKPQGIPSQPDMSGCIDMTVILKEHLNSLGEKDDIFVVHRLDRATGGIILYARNKKAAAEFSQLVAQKEGFEKHYLAIVSGTPKEKCDTMNDYLFKDSAQKKSFVVKNERKGAKIATLDYEVKQSITEENNKTFSLLEIKLHTGRFHQIRAQFSSHGMPIYADGKYGSREKAPHFALWASKIAFTYKDKHYEFESSPNFDISPWILFNN